MDTKEDGIMWNMWNYGGFLQRGGGRGEERRGRDFLVCFAGIGGKEREVRYLRRVFHVKLNHRDTETQRREGEVHRGGR